MMLFLNRHPDRLLEAAEDRTVHLLQMAQARMQPAVSQFKSWVKSVQVIQCSPVAFFCLLYKRVMEAEQRRLPQLFPRWHTIQAL
jgi:hypothetical protein